MIPNKFRDKKHKSDTKSQKINFNWGEKNI